VTLLGVQGRVGHEGGELIEPYRIIFAGKGTARVRDVDIPFAGSVDLSPTCDEPWTSAPTTNRCESDRP
jgi:hypothetical protein